MKISPSLQTATYSFLTYVPKTLATTITNIAHKFLALIKKIFSAVKNLVYPKKLTLTQTPQHPSNLPLIAPAFGCALLFIAIHFFDSSPCAKSSSALSIIYPTPSLQSPMCFLSDAPSHSPPLLPVILMSLSLFALPFALPSQQIPEYPLIDDLEERLEQVSKNIEEQRQRLEEMAERHENDFEKISAKLEALKAKNAEAD